MQTLPNCDMIWGVNGHFYLFGGIASLVLHGALLGVLALTVGESPSSADAVLAAGPETVPDAVTPAAATASVARPSVSPSGVPATAAASSPPLSASPAERKRLARETPPVPAEEWREYVVRPGDTLTLLARRTGTSFTEIARANKKTVAALSRLKVGQRIKLPPVPAD